jgi:hypothetical protein
MTSRFIAFLIFCALTAHATTREEKIREESQAALERSLRLADAFYTLDAHEDIREMTWIILNSSETNEDIKQQIRTTGRRFFLFEYPSDGFQVKGYISFVPNPTENPLLIFLRGGNRQLGLMHPATEFGCVRN